MLATRMLHALAAVAVAGTVLLVPAAASAADTHHTAPVASTADVDDFSYASWDAHYDVGLDEDGRSQLRVTETLVARFPDFDQNRGIVRGLPLTYENAHLETSVLSVTDETGAAVPFETEQEDGFLLVLTGDDDYVRGLTTYVIEYEMSDVILHRDDGRADEFYWDLLPLDSSQAIESFQAEITFDAAMAARLTGSARCYTGFSGSTEECALQGPDAEGDAAVFRVESGERAAGDGVTVAIGFEPGTAAQPSAREPNTVTDTVPALAAVGAFGLSAGGCLAVTLLKRRRRTATGLVIAQYDVPDWMPPLLAAAITPNAKDPIPAEIVHLAVRGTLRIEESGGGEEPGTAGQPQLRRTPGGRIPDQLDVESLDALFLGADAAGVVSLPLTDDAFAGRMNALIQSGKSAATSRGLTTKARSRGAMILQWCAIAVVAAGLGLSLWGAVSGRVTAIPALVAVCFGALAVLASSLYTFSKHTVLTPEGAVAHEYLLGVREFIRVAEADRLQMLQSYTGAERRQDGSVNVVLLYERLLPYAMLFGQEDEWGGVLESAYVREQRGPGWIGDPSSPYLRTHLAAFAVSSHAAATYSSSSSSSGGSSGGGFSGGGGGGGFSGGR
ncbi:DUF2207 family protein [Microbacterium aurantiacum]|uniref:DUF2207 family protein n=1 Tax=Microbacterium aurantiacum TaxID=162393 RepID=UPI000C8019D7|nr:DUF2207 domain-containing protein [Microbacterium aurantiacum]